MAEESAGDVTRSVVTALLLQEVDSRKSVETRAATLVATSGALASLLFAATNFARSVSIDNGQEGLLDGDPAHFLRGSVAALIFSVVVGSIVLAPWRVIGLNFESPETQAFLEKESFRSAKTRVDRVWALQLFDLLKEQRRVVRKKAGLLTLAFIFQAVGVVLTGAALWQTLP
jgi:hypothetical protein